MFTKTALFTIVFSFLFFIAAKAQNMDANANAKVKVIDFFTAKTSKQSEVYNGVVYLPPVKATKGSIFFQDKSYLINGSLTYKGTTYTNIPLLYDVFNEFMIAASPDGINFILPSDKVSDLTFDDHHFINLKNTTLKPGFYDELYSGKSEVLVKRKKGYSESLNSGHLEIYYNDDEDIYVKKDGRFFIVSGQGSFFDVFKDKKKELKQYLSDNHIRYNKDPEKAIVALTTYYDQLTK